MLAVTNDSRRTTPLAEPLRTDDLHVTTFQSRDKSMKRYAGLIRDTWWLWIVMFGGGLLAGYFQPVFFTSIPIILFAFFYFGLMRYNAEGELTPFDQDSGGD